MRKRDETKMSEPKQTFYVCLNIYSQRSLEINLAWLQQRIEDQLSVEFQKVVVRRIIRQPIKTSQKKHVMEGLKK